MSTASNGIQAPVDSAESQEETPAGRCLATSQSNEVLGEFRLAPEAAAQEVLPERFRGALKRKRDVSLYIKEGKVVMQFAYNDLVKEAVKNHVRGRQWDPSVGLKGSWTCPIESLPDAVALWEHMGRAPTAELDQRAKDVQSCGGSRGISLQIRISPSTLENRSLGSVRVTFQYDADLVAAMKQLAPSTRSYDAPSRTWNVELLVLPELLEHLQPLGYSASTEMASIVKACEQLEQLLSSSNATSPTTSEESQSFKAALMTLVQLVRGRAPEALDRSNYGTAKRRKLTSQQKAWNGEPDFDHHHDDLFDLGLDLSLVLGRFSSFRLPVLPPADCDCGHPNRLVAGRHCCRYFGTFACRCGNQWTSAYCWKGEKQACRKCNFEQFPAKTEPLDGRAGLGTGKAHDVSRCSKCKSLGYDCSGSALSLSFSGC